jgi:serine/threonine-protein kinase RIM15
MWMVRPSVIREVTIDLPEVLVESLGVGAEVLAHYLTGLAEQSATNPGDHPPPLPVLCRICERQITPWWFEKHSELCLQEHRAEMEVQMAHETLAEHRNAIVKVLDTLESHSQRSRAAAMDPVQPVAPAEYKGLIIHSPRLRLRALHLDATPLLLHPHDLANVLSVRLDSAIIAHDLLPSGDP